jgi:hypothetical protein
MKHIDIDQLLGAVPVVQRMTRREKLLHWAALIRRTKRDLGLYHALEYMSPWQRQDIVIGTDNVTALGIAASDPVFQAQGLNATTSIEGALRFFDLTLTQAHAFSCDCGGAISNEQQAQRIERLA